MKHRKKIFASPLSLLLLLSVVAIPTSAVGSPYYSHICGFEELYNGSPANAYIRAVQAFLYYYPDTRSTIISGGGIDGGYGNATESAVRTYQQDKWPYTSSEWDGRVGPKTWEKIATDLYLDDFGNNEVYLCHYGGHVMYVDLRAEGYTYYSCNSSGAKDRYIEWH